MRHERVRGVGNTKQTETLLIVSQNAITLPPVKYQVYPGGTTGDVVGPAVLSPAETQWQATWAEKMKILGPGQLIEVGGKLEAGAPEPKRKKPRTDYTVEPVFFHSMLALLSKSAWTRSAWSGSLTCAPGRARAQLLARRRRCLM